MSRLLWAGFARLWKSAVFWIGMLVMFGLSLLLVIVRYRDRLESPDYVCSPDEIMFSGGMYMGLVIAVFVGIFIGTEYSDGTIRNKLIAGHSRMVIYLSNLVICTTASVFMHLIYIAVMLGAGIPLLGKLQTDGIVLAIQVLWSIMAIMAYTAFFLFVSMLIQRKSTGVVITMIASLVLLMGALTIRQRMMVPEYETKYAVVNDEVVPYEGTEKNPHYLTGIKRDLYEFLCDFLPSGQILQLGQNLQSGQDFPFFGSYDERWDYAKRFPMYSLFIIVITTAGGSLIFGKKDLK